MKRLFSVLVILVLAAGAYGATITVTKPAMGETVIKGQTYVITWSKSGDMPNAVKISLRDKNSTSVVQEIVDPALNSGSYSWPVPASIPDGQYVIRVKVKTVSVQDDSDVFNIAAAAPPPAATVTVTKPASGDKWNRDKPYTIAWTKTGTQPNSVKISLMDQNSVSVVREIVDGAANTGSFPWTVPADVPFGEYHVRVLVKTTQIMDDSDKFSIALISIPGGTIPSEKKKVGIKLPGTVVPVGYQEYTKPAIYKNWMGIRDQDASTYQTLALLSARPTCYTPGAVNQHAEVGYDYFPGQGEYVPSWITGCHRSQVTFQVGEFQGQAAKLISAKLNLKQVKSLIVGDTHASCGVGLSVFTAPWTNFYNFSVTSPEGLNFGSTDYSVDVTDIVKKWLDGTWPNYGLLLISQEVYWGQQTKTCLSLFEASLTLRFKKD
jgi:hypothetical protein